MIRRWAAAALVFFFAAAARAGEPEAWYPIESPTAEGLSAVSFAPDGAGFAAGANGTVLRREGEAWQVLPFPYGSIHLLRVAALSSSEAWFVAAYSNTLYHFEGGRWSTAVLAQDFVASHIDFLRPDLGYVVGLFGMMYRYDGERWERVVAAALPADRESHLEGVAVLGASDVWVGTSHFLLHFDGADWQRLPLPEGSSSGLLQRAGSSVALLGGPLLLRRGASWERLSPRRAETVALSATNEVWGIILENRPRFLLRLSPEGSEFVLPDRHIHGLARGPDGVWAVGNFGAILRLEPRRLPAFVDQTFEAGAGVQARSTVAMLVDLDGAGAREMLLARPFGRNSFLRAEEAGTFRPQPIAVPALSDWPNANSLAPVDIDGDGWVDLVLRPFGRAAERPIHVMRNLGSFRFWDATADLAPLAPADAMREGDITVADLDSDGDLDIYEARFLTDVGGYQVPNVLYRNDGFGRLTRRALAHHDGGASLAWSRSALAADFTGDGRTDLVTLNAWGQGNLLYRQGEDGNLSAMPRSGLEGAFQDPSGAAAGDIDGDGALDLLVLGFVQFGPSRLYRNDGRGHFRDVTSESGLDRIFVSALRAEFADMDLDGDLDLVLAGAMLRRPSAPPGGRLRLLVNDGRGHFTDVTAKASLDQIAQDVAVDDFDEDGDLDIYIVRPGDANRLLASDPPDHGFLKVHLQSPAPNRQAIGARVSIFGPDGALVGFRETNPRQPIAHFGLGDLASVTVEVRFPSGRVVRREAIPAKSAVAVAEVSRPALWARDAVFFLRHRWAWADRPRVVLAFGVALVWLLGLSRAAAWLGARRFLRRGPVMIGLLALHAGSSIAWAPLLPISFAARAGPFGLLFGLGLLLLFVDRALTRRSEASFVGPYEIVAPLGQGGMGMVYKARDKSQARRPVVAVKVLRPERVGDPESMRRFIREAEIGARLSHSGIVSVLASGECRILEGRAWRRTAYLAMEYVEGTSLASLLSGGERLPLVRAVEIARDAAVALGAAHAAGVLHRDIKPDNLLLSRAGVVKLVDFGIAALARAPKETAPGILIGTLAYLPPERAMGRAEDTRGDLYALGVILYELVCGRLPFEEAAKDTGSLLAAVISTLAPPPASLVGHIPARLDALIMALLAKDPEQRPASAEEVAEVLGDVLRELRGEAIEARALARAERAPALPPAPEPAPLPRVVRREDAFERETLDLPMPEVGGD